MHFFTASRTKGKQSVNIKRTVELYTKFRKIGTKVGHIQNLCRDKNISTILVVFAFILYGLRNEYCGIEPKCVFFIRAQKLGLMALQNNVL